MLESLGKYAQGKGLHMGDRLGTGLTVAEGSGEIRDLCDPALVILSVSSIESVMDIQRCSRRGWGTTENIARGLAGKLTPAHGLRREARRASPQDNRRAEP